MDNKVEIIEKGKNALRLFKASIADILGLQAALDSKADKVEFTAEEGRSGGIIGLDDITIPDFYCGVYRGFRASERYAATLSVTLSMGVLIQEIEYDAPNGKKRYKRSRLAGVWSEWELVPNTIAIADVDGLQTALEYKMDATPHLADSGEMENIDALYASHKGAAIVIDNFAGKSLSEYLYSASGKPIYLSNDLQQSAFYLIRVQYIDYAYLVEAIAFNEPMSNQ